MVVHRQKLRRGAADGLCGVFQGRRCPRAVARRWLAIFVLDAGEAANVGSGSVSPAYCTLFSVFVLCTVYVVLCSIYVGFHKKKGSVSRFQNRKTDKFMGPMLGPLLGQAVSAHLN